ncbi:MAG: insulinase family protein [Gemmatimonadales bacterium]|nr:insulinase family protein [Gemmatimonadales bacterium]
MKSKKGVAIGGGEEARSPFTVDSSRIWTKGVTKEVLPNGLTLLIQPDHSAPVVAVVTHVEAGFFDEPDRWTGISHVLEHMFFKGTPRRGVGAIARETKSAGGYLNASTTYDHTSYFTVLPASGLEAALDIQSDALRNSLIDQGELTRELQVIIQEAKRKLDSPSSVAYETLHEVMFDRHRIRRWRIGHEDQLARLTRHDLWAYYRSRYVPERTIVAIVGAVDAERALELARAAYGEWPPSAGAVDRSPEEPERREVRARTLRGDVSQAELVLGWRAVPPLHPDATALDLAAAVLGSGRGSWLYRSLREPGIVTWAAAHNYAPTELGVFSVSAELRPERLESALAGVAEAVSRLALVGPTADELDRARTLVRARWARRLESMEGRASALAAAEALADVGLLDREYALLAEIGPDQVREAGARYLAPDAVAGVAYLPSAEGRDLTADALARAFAVTQLRPATDIVAPRPRRRPAVPARSSREHGVRVTRLPGADLLVYRKSGVPLVNLGIYVPRTAFDPPAKAGLGSLLVRAAARGAGELDGAALAFAFERLGGTLATSSASDWLGFGASVLSENLAEAALLLDSVFSQPHLNDPDVAAERGLMMAEAEQVADDMFRYPFQLAFSAAFGERGYGLPVGGLPETLSAIAPADVRAWQATALVGVRPVVLAVGDVDPERASDELAGVFAARPAVAVAELSQAVEWIPRAGVESPVRVVSRDKAQAALAMAFPGPSRRDPDHAAAQVWGAVASGLGGRLFEALRDRRSLAYTVVATAWQKARGGALLTYIATSPEREEEAREEMLAELERFTREPVAGAELGQAVNYLAGQAEVSRQSGAAVAGEILEAWLAGGGLEELADPAARFRAVEAGDIQRVAALSLDPTRKAEGVVRGTGAARPPVAATAG